MTKENKRIINEKVLSAAKYGDKLSEKIRPINKVGSFRHSQYSVDHTAEFTQYLDSLKLKYVIGNDSPRGGQLGKFIQVKIDRRNTFIKENMQKVIA